MKRYPAAAYYFTPQGQRDDQILAYVSSLPLGCQRAATDWFTPTFHLTGCALSNTTSAQPSTTSPPSSGPAARSAMPWPLLAPTQSTATSLPLIARAIPSLPIATVTRGLKTTTTSSPAARQPLPPTFLPLPLPDLHRPRPSSRPALARSLPLSSPLPFLPPRPPLSLATRPTPTSALPRPGCRVPQLPSPKLRPRCR